jgi:hypothetical protein
MLVVENSKRFIGNIGVSCRIVRFKATTPGDILQRASELQNTDKGAAAVHHILV